MTFTDNVPWWQGWGQEWGGVHGNYSSWSSMVVFCGAGGVEGGITGHLLVAILDHSGYKTVTTRDLIGMFFVGVGMGWVWVKWGKLLAVIFDGSFGGYTTISSYMMVIFCGDYKTVASNGPVVCKQGWYTVFQQSIHYNSMTYT